jgi:DNA-binding LacI/PurR family transcriptional regulator
MKKQPATIRDIAIRLNISISTVSRALRNAPDINPETKKAVHEMAKNLKYEPNRVAQSMRSRKTYTIGVVVPEIVMHFFSSTISGIQEYAAEHRYSTVICQSMESDAIERSNIQMLISNRVDGLLISLSSQTKNYDHLYQLIERQIPVVLFDRVAHEVPVSKVIVDDHDGAFRATHYMIQTGCKNIAYLGGPEHLSINNERQRGYSDALRQSNLEVRDELIFHSIVPICMIQSRPSGIYCNTNPMVFFA